MVCKHMKAAADVYHRKKELADNGFIYQLRFAKITEVQYIEMDCAFIKYVELMFVSISESFTSV